VSLNEKALVEARKKLLDTALGRFTPDPAVMAVFLGGSLAAGSSDAWSDIDLRVVVRPEDHARFVAARREITRSWPGFLFNEWVPGAQYCVSHFSPFGKIDIFYLNQAHLAPSPWYTLPIRILHDPSGVVASLLERSKEERFDVSEDDIDFSISKGLAAAHEAYRRAMRGELSYAQTLLDELRHHVMRADDWLYRRTPETAVFAKFERRGGEETLAALAASYPHQNAEAILRSLYGLVRFYREQVAQLHEQFQPSRPLSVDLEALDTVLVAVMPPSV
jgi:predicted nucleotidyltransferase